MNHSLHKIIDTLKAHMTDDTLIWHNPCLIRTQSNIASGNPYRGVNQFITAIVAHAEGYRSPWWGTFKQIQALGGQLIDAKGRGVPILFYKQLPSRDSDEDHQERFVIRHSFVFNLDLIEGIAPEAAINPEEGNTVPIACAEQIAHRYLAREKIRIRHGTPAYVPATDLIQMPAYAEISSTDEYYSTYFHELAHSTGHPQRLCRFGVGAGRFDSKEDYSREELVAEITAAMLCHDSGVDSQASIKNSAAYLQGWSRFIADKGDALLAAVNQAYKAREFILSEEGS